MFSNVRWRLQFGVVVGLCAAGLDARQRTPGTDGSSAFAVAGSVIKDCAVCPELVVVPAGQFLMGSPTEERDRLDDEGPVHHVTIPRPFAAGKYEVTFDECVADDYNFCNRTPNVIGCCPGVDIAFCIDNPLDPGCTCVFNPTPVCAQANVPVLPEIGCGAAQSSPSSPSR